MRLVTWNCCRGAYDRKAARLEALRPDVVVLQECPCPTQPNLSAAWFGSNPRQGVAVIGRSPYRVRPEPVRGESQSMFAAHVIGPIPFTVVAVWARPEPSYSQALRRGLEVYRDLFLAGPTVLVGDFNSSAAWDDRHGRTDHRELDAQLEREFGMLSAYHVATGEQPGKESRPTHYWRWQETAPFHLDYCYFPRDWLAGLKEVSVGGYREWADVSDHRPLVVEVSPAGIAV